MDLVNIHPVNNKVRSRRLRFSGARNFRDLGGYQTSSGKSVRWGVLYRSDSLHKLTQTDLARLQALNIKKMIDFRAKYEVEKEPDNLPAGVQLVNLFMEDSSTKVWHEARDAMVRNMRSLDPAEYMVRTNVELATIFTPGYKQFFAELLSANGDSIVFHCAAGKDRTGFAAASLLRILGVPFESVLQDYLLTNRYLLDAFRWSLLLGKVLKGREFTNGIRGFMKADEMYLNAAFEALEKEHGSFESYVRNGLVLTPQAVDRLKSQYLE